MPFSNKPWSQFSAADYPDAQSYCDACLINENSGPRSGWTKDACKLPVREPDGMLNRNGIHAAATRLAGAGGGVQASSSSKKAAARKLARFYGEMDEEPPESMRRMAM